MKIGTPSYENIDFWLRVSGNVRQLRIVVSGEHHQTQTYQQLIPSLIFSAHYTSMQQYSVLNICSNLLTCDASVSQYAEYIVNIRC
jgi:hypothetical protein